MFLQFMRQFRRFFSCQKAVSALEYAILAGVVVAVVGAAIATFSNSVSSSIDALGTKISTGTQSVPTGQLGGGGGNNNNNNNNNNNQPNN